VFVASGGSFDTADGYLMVQQGWGKNTLGVSAEGALTDRYLDPPVLDDFTNRATTSSFAAHYERDLTERDRLGFIVRREQTVFQVPNEFLQQAAGQRQDRNSNETIGILSYQHVFSSNVLGDFRLMSRDDSSGLSSNPQSTPIIAGQQRSVHEVYAKGNISIHHGIHEIKAGADMDYGSIHEQFNYAITDFSQFDPDTPPTFRRFYGQAQNFRIECNHGRRTGEQNIFRRWCLENPVIGSVEHQISPRPIPGYSEPGARCVAIDHQVVVVPSQAGAQGQAAETHQVLDI
jgi:hypothetical protein